MSFQMSSKNNRKYKYKKENNNFKIKNVKAIDLSYSQNAQQNISIFHIL